MELPDEVQLESGEKIKTILKRRFDSWLMPNIVFFAVLLIITPIVMIALNTYSPLLYLTIFPIAYANALLAVVVNILIILGLFGLSAGLGYMYVKSHKYILTNRKVIIYKKFVILSMREVTYSRITDIVMNVGLFGRLLNYGEIVPISGAMEMSITTTLNYSLKGIFAPVKIFNLIDSLRLQQDDGTVKEAATEEIIEEFLEAKDLPSQIRLFPEEKVLYILKRSYMSYFWRVIWFPVILLIITIVMIVMTPTIASLSPIYFTVGFVLSIVFAVLTCLAALALLIGKFYVDGHTYVVTTNRILMLRVFFVISYRELDFDDISDITVNQGPFGRIFKYGTLQPLTYGVEFGLMTFLLSMDGVPNPHDIKPKILEYMRKFKEKKF